MAEEAGFKAVYLSGGSLGWVKMRHRGQPDAAGNGRGRGRHARGPASCRSCSTPAAAGAIRCTCTAPSRWRRPRASRRSRSRTSCCRGGWSTTSASTISCRPSSSCKKLKEALAARTDPNLVIIARTNARARRRHRRGGAPRRSLRQRPAPTWCSAITRSPEELRFGRRAGAAAADDVRAGGRLRHVRAVAAPSYAKLGYRLAASSGTAFAAMYKAVAAVLRVPRQRHARSVPRQGRRRADDEGGAEDLRASTACSRSSAGP